MEEIEVPIEQAQEHLHHAAHESSERWISRAALASGIIAVFAAIAAMLGGAHANEAVLSQLKASDSWNYYQAKGVKSTVLSSKMELLKELGKAELADDEKKIETYRKEQAEIAETAKMYSEAGEHHLHIHEWMARSVTLFQIGIALGAIAVLSRKKSFWYTSLGFAGVGLGLLIRALLL